MKKALGMVAIVAMIAAPAMATTWDFNDWSNQGWVISGPGAGIAGNPVELNQDNVPDPSNNTGAIYLPDTSVATMAVDSTDSFQFSAEVTGAAGNINRLKSAGLGYRFTYDADTTNPRSLTPADAVDAWFEGKSSGGAKVGFKDTYSGAGSGGGDYLDSFSGDQWSVVTVKLIIDYNFTHPGEIWLGFEEVDYIYDGTEPAMKFYGNAATNDALGGAVEPINMIRLGGAYSWSQFYADNVEFIVPEPATLTLLGLGALALVRRRR